MARNQETPTPSSLPRPTILPGPSAAGRHGIVAEKAAPAPARIIEKSLVSDRVVIDTVVAKYSDHLPLYREAC
jgi:transposase